jgi:hypothetical protein
MRLLLPLLFIPLAAIAADGEPEKRSPPVPVERFAGSFADVEQLTDAQLKRFYLECSRAAVRGRITSGDVQVCSVGYERLLQKSFGGDFRAFLDWRRQAVRRGEAS